MLFFNMHKKTHHIIVPISRFLLTTVRFLVTGSAWGSSSTPTTAWADPRIIHVKPLSHKHSDGVVERRREREERKNGTQDRQKRVNNSRGGRGSFHLVRDTRCAGAEIYRQDTYETRERHTTHTERSEREGWIGCTALQKWSLFDVGWWARGIEGSASFAQTGRRTSRPNTKARDNLLGSGGAGWCVTFFYPVIGRRSGPN